MKKLFFLAGLTVLASTVPLTPLQAATNRPPTANSQSVVTQEDTAVNIVLTATDPEGAALTYKVVNAPTKGKVTCSGTGAQCVYTPTTNLNGTDFFSFQASDGSLSSRKASVSITISAVNDAPVVETGTTYVYNEDYTATIRPAVSDVDGDTVSLQIVSQPSLGAVTVSGTTLTFTPNSNAYGSTSFTYTGSDGKTASSVGTIYLTINPVNDAPTVTDQAVVTYEDTVTAISLNASDVDSTGLTVTFGHTPIYGTLTAVGTTVTYTPAAQLSGTDSFTYRVSDGSLSSAATATVTITITAVNDKPTIAPLDFEVASGNTAIVNVVASDVEGSALTFSLASQPSYGTASLLGDSLVYTANQSVGEDSFSVVASDGTDQSAPAVVTVHILSSATITPISITDLEPLNVTTTSNGQTTVTTLASDGCYEFTATPLLLPVQLQSGEIVEAAFATLYSKCLNRTIVDHYGFLIFTNDGSAWRFTSEREKNFEFNAKATGVFNPTSGEVWVPIESSGDSSDANAVSGGLWYQGPNGDTQFLNPFTSRSIDTSALLVNSLLFTGSANRYVPTYQTGAKVDAEYGGILGFINTYSKTIQGDLAFYANNGYEAWLTAAPTQAIETDGAGNVVNRYTAWGTGPGGNLGDAPDVGGACSVFTTSTSEMINAVVSNIFPTFDLFNQQYDPGDKGCANLSGMSTITLEGSAFQGEVTPGFDPNNGQVTFWAKAYEPDVAGSEQTRISELDHAGNLKCEALITGGAAKNPFNGVGTGMAIDADGNAYTNADVYDATGRLNTDILSIDPTNCSVTTLLELNSAVAGWSLSGVTLGVDANGEDVVLAATAGTLYVYHLVSQAVDTYALGNADPVMASPVIDSAGRVVVISTNNVVTIINDLGLSYGHHFWPRFRKDNYGSASVETVVAQ